MLSRPHSRPLSNFIEPCLPRRADKPLAGRDWIHEIKHDGFRIMARRDAAGVRLLTRNGHDFAGRFPLAAAAVAALPAHSCLIDDCAGNGLDVCNSCSAKDFRRSALHRSRTAQRRASSAFARLTRSSLATNEQPSVRVKVSSRLAAFTVEPITANSR